MRIPTIILLLALAGLVCADTGGDIADEINNVICLFVRLIWVVTGSLMAIVIVFAGIKWLVSGEDAGARAFAKTFIVSAFVGLIIVFTAVPVVDYLVGSTLGYEFRCGFFPEIDSGVFMDEEVAESPEDVGLTVQSVDPLNPSSGAVLELDAPVLSRSVSGLGGLFVCFEVSNTGDYPADIGDSAVALYSKGSFVSLGVCSYKDDFLGAGGSVNVVCDIGSSLPEDLQTDLGSYDLYVRVGDVGSSYGIKDLVVNPACTGMVTEEKLYTLSSESKLIAGIGVPAEVSAGESAPLEVELNALKSGYTIFYYQGPLPEGGDWSDERWASEKSTIAEVSFDGGFLPAGRANLNVDVSGDGFTGTYPVTWNVPDGLEPGLYRFIVLAAEYGEDGLMRRQTVYSAFNVGSFLNIVMVPAGYDFPSEWAEFVRQAEIVKDAWIAKTPFRECANPGDHIKFYLLDEDCGGVKEYADASDLPGALETSRDCIQESEYVSIADIYVVLYNGDLAEKTNLAGSSEESEGFAIVRTKHHFVYSQDGISLDEFVDTDGIDAVHEIGHLFGLDHCSGETCIMNPFDYDTTVKADSEGNFYVASITAKNQEFCPDCYAALKEKLLPYLVGC